MTETLVRGGKKVLLRYALDGYLDFGSDKYSSDLRYKAGNQLFTDFILGGGDGVKAIDMSKIRVDGGGNGEKTAKCSHHHDMYNKAMASVPDEFWPVVRKVCIDDEEIRFKGSDLDVKRKLYAARVDLCRGLDRLVEFYYTKRYRL